MDFKIIVEQYDRLSDKLIADWDFPIEECEFREMYGFGFDEYRGDCFAVERRHVAYLNKMGIHVDVDNSDYFVCWVQA